LWAIATIIVVMNISYAATFDRCLIAVLPTAREMLPVVIRMSEERSPRWLVATLGQAK
jgi:hypothetical protein